MDYTNDTKIEEKKLLAKINDLNLRSRNREIILSDDQDKMNSLFLKYDIYNSVTYHDDNSFSLNHKITDNLYLGELERFLKEHNYSLDENVIEINNYFTDINNKQLNKLTKEMKMRNYYGSAIYMRERLYGIRDAVDYMLNSPDLNDNEKQLCNRYIQNIRDGYLNAASICNKKLINPAMYDFDAGYEIDDEDYKAIEREYKKIIIIEKELEPISERIWNKYYEEKDFYLAHFFSDSFVEASKMGKICCSLYTKDLCTLTKSGYLFKPDFKKIATICPEDVGSWFIKKEDVIENRSMQYVDNVNMSYEYGYNTKLFLPKFIEEKGIANDSERDLLNNNLRYTEIVLYDPQLEIKPDKVFYTDNTSSDEIIVLKDLAEKQNVPLTKINIQKYVDKHNDRTNKEK